MRDEAAFWERESLEWYAKRAKLTMLLDDTDAVMPQTEFDELSNYSTSLPTGTPFGKIWRRQKHDNGCWVNEWMMGEYYDVKSKTQVGIRWRTIHIVEGERDD